MSRKYVPSWNVIWEPTVAHNLERVHEFYHDDVVVEFPQSGNDWRLKHTNTDKLTAHI